MAEATDFRRVATLASVLMQNHLKKGDVAIDATAGTGEDTCMMAEAVGQNGMVFAFDIQKEAIEITMRKLCERGLDEQVMLFCAGHETMAMQEAIQKAGPVKGIMFNLGFLPGGDKTVCTQTETSLQAVKGALILLAKGGLMTICLYPHPEGLEEGCQIENYLSALGAGYNVHKVKTLNRANPPWLLIIEKTK